MTPETRYANSGGVSIAYQVLGEGPLDLVVVTGFASNLDIYWEEPSVDRFYRRLASFSRLILFDKRGTGLSDRVAELPSLEVRMDDVRAVMDAAGSPRAALFGSSEGGPMCALFAATYPERTLALIMHGSYARPLVAPGYEWGRSQELNAAMLRDIERNWGKPIGLRMRAPSMSHDERFAQWWARLLRMGASPSAAIALQQMNSAIDIRDVLPSIRVPALILHSVDDQSLNVGLGRYLAEHIPRAKFVELPGPDHVPYLSDSQTITDEIEEFLTGVRHEPALDRVLATVLFTDIVGATETAARLGDQRWRELLVSHHDAVRRELARFRGREIDTAGDGFFATFDGPARAVRCACAIRDAMWPLGIELRAGVHTGECEVMGVKVGGIAVHIGARIANCAAAGEVLVSRTVKDLVAGSGLEFVDRGEPTLKGVPGSWPLFAVLR
jgi:class 3 adenylate cyclase